MSDRPRFFDDIAGVAGGAISALGGAAGGGGGHASRSLDDLIQRLDLVRREELAAIQELAANARAGQEAAEADCCHTDDPVFAELEARVTALEGPNPFIVSPGGDGEAPRSRTGGTVMARRGPYGTEAAAPPNVMKKNTSKVSGEIE